MPANWFVWEKIVKLQRSISENLLNQSLIRASDAILRELAMACKKVSIYNSLHPVSERSLQRLHRAFDDAFEFKKYVIFNIESGRLHVMHVRQRETVFAEEVARYLQTLELRAVCFHDTINLGDLSTIVERLVKREKVAPPSNFVPEYLKKKNIAAIEANSELAHRLFEKNVKYRGDIDRDFTVRQVASEQLGGDLLRLCELYDNNDQALADASIDFNNEIIQFLIPEKVSSLKADDMAEQLGKIITGHASFGSDQPHSEKKQKQLGRLLSLHPERSAIVNSLHILHGGAAATLIRESILPSAGDFDNSAFAELADYESKFLTLKDSDSGAFAEIFLRFYKTGRRGQSIEIVDYLIKQLSVSDWHHRQKALNFLTVCLKGIDIVTDKFILENVVVRLSEIIKNNAENIEHSDLISFVLEQGCHSRRFPIIAELIDSLARRRTESNGVMVFDSIAVKSALLKLNRAEILIYLIDELAKGNLESSKVIQRILLTIGTEEVAQALIKIISHPSRQLRQQVLKILADMGLPALTVCASVLNNKANFERPSDRSELPDYKWYLIRNALYVIGAVKNPAAVEQLRYRINDPDIRVRREIIMALEKIGGEDACDIFLLMAEDISAEIRDLALTKFGIIGNPESVPLIIDLIKRSPQLGLKGIQTIGQLGGETGRTFLTQMLTDEQMASDLIQGRISKGDFKVALIRALARLGDSHSIETIRQFRKSLSNTQRILLGSSTLDIVISEVLKTKK